MSFWIEVEPTGRIRSTAQVPEDVTPRPLVPGNTMVEVETLVDPKRWAWFDGVLVDIGEAPSPSHVFDWIERDWHDPRDLDWFKEARWAVIKEQRDAIEFGPFTYNGMVFDGDRDAQRRLNFCISIAKMALMASQPFSVSFVLHDNSSVELAAIDFVNIEQVKGQQVLEAFAIAMQLREQIEAATTVTEVEAVQWPS